MPMNTNNQTCSKWEVHLCPACIQDLENYYPYIVPRKRLAIVPVSMPECDNHHLDDYNERLTTRNKNFVL